MEQNNDKQIKVSGPLNDPMTLARLKAVAKANTEEHQMVALDKATIKVATGFGAVDKEITTEREVEPVVEGDEHSLKIKAELDSQLENGISPSSAALTSGMQSGGMNSTVVPEEKLEETKELRDKLAQIWSKDAKDTDPSADFYIEGIDMGNTAIKNPDAGDSGVRISFKRGK